MSALADQPRSPVHNIILEAAFRGLPELAPPRQQGCCALGPLVLGYRNHYVANQCAKVVFHPATSLFGTVAACRRNRHVQAIAIRARVPTHSAGPEADGCDEGEG